MKNTLTNWLLAVAIFGLFAGAPQLDGPSDHATEQAQAEDLQTAIKNEAAQARFAGAAAEICGNSNWSQDSDGAVVCHLHKPHGAGVVLTSMGYVGAQP